MTHNRPNAMTEWAGCTYRQLDHWWAGGLIPGAPVRTGSGRHRTWTAGMARAVSFLTAAAPCTPVAQTARAAAAVAATMLPGQVLLWWPQLNVHQGAASLDHAASLLADLIRSPEALTMVLPLERTVATAGWLLLWQCPDTLPEGTAP